jgi:two-component system CheB/CheR fusion protein
VIQDPDTAAFGGMPGSLAPNTVDIVAPLGRIGPLLGDLVMGVKVSEGRTEAEERRELKRFLEELKERHGIDFRSYKTPTIMRRLKRRMAATGALTIAEYSRHVEENPEEYRQIVNSFLIKVTEFFRDPDLFEYLKTEILPELINEAREQGSQLRIWSAGCATGEEGYSLAILLSEVLGEQAGRFDTRIFATDVDGDAVNFARHGIYPASALSNLSEEQIERYFVREDGHYQVRKSVRGMIVFGEHDLVQRSPFPRIDLVLSRNVLIYFTPELQRRVLQLFAHSLRDGGYLVLGKAETTSPLDGFFEQSHRHHKVYRRQGERFLVTPHVPVSPAPMPPERPVRRSGRAPHAALPDLRRDSQRRTRVAEEDLLSRLPVGVVLLDRGYHIQAINPTARRLLSIHGVAVGEDLLHLLQSVPYAEVRKAIDAAFRGKVDADTGPFAIEDVATGEASHLRLVCRPMQAEGERGLVQTVAVVVNDLTEAARASRELEQRFEAVQVEFEQFRRDSEAETLRRSGQNERLIEKNRQLEEANRELTALNQELQIVNKRPLSPRRRRRPPPRRSRRSTRSFRRPTRSWRRSTKSFRLRSRS